MSRPKEKPKLRKLQFTVDAKTVENLEESRRINQDSSLAQAFRRATAFSHLLDIKRAEGYEVLLKKGDEIYKLFIP